MKTSGAGLEGKKKVSEGKNGDILEFQEFREQKWCQEPFRTGPYVFRAVANSFRCRLSSRLYFEEKNKGVRKE